MSYQTLLLSEVNSGIEITLNRSEHENTLNEQLINELHQVLDDAEKNPAYRIIALKGQQGLFCTGMDFHEALHAIAQEKEMLAWSSLYMRLLKRFASSAKIIIAMVDGQVLAGGMGLVAASDLVIATPQSQFCLSEALWGLLPANVLPYLIRRIGFQKAYAMTLTTQTIMGQEAQAIHLVDELTEQLDDTLRKYTLRLSRLTEQTIRNLKNYFQKMWILNENMEKMAALELTRLMQEPTVQQNIKQFIENGKLPWECIHD